MKLVFPLSNRSVPISPVISLRALTRKIIICAAGKSPNNFWRNTTELTPIFLYPSDLYHYTGYVILGLEQPGPKNYRLSFQFRKSGHRPKIFSDLKRFPKIVILIKFWMCKENRKFSLWGVLIKYFVFSRKPLKFTWNYQWNYWEYKGFSKFI